MDQGAGPGRSSGTGRTEGARLGLGLICATVSQWEYEQCICLTLLSFLYQVSRSLESRHKGSPRLAYRAGSFETIRSLHSYGQIQVRAHVSNASFTSPYILRQYKHYTH